MAKKNAIPKKVAGFKVPRTIRKSKPLKALLGSKTGRDILGKALMAGAAAAAAVLAEEREEVAAAGRKGARKGARAMGIAGDAIQSAAHAAMTVVTDSARSFMPENKERHEEEEGDERPFGSAARH
ncbi:hypothetical protein REJC140_01784 [Pseudorhizobium endolithicum]|uniref:Uncharacterized protein n=1 Tax=Pseudorhizobium endolithicum TaxID=1191678 RepID=A0ABN7JZZ4_9HYPH|nr:hypothetical protein [Pseudorhizobium endolithicum]CAD6427002.1 hypothetical protein REQ54_02953 [Rhizobium sp. Q54]CAD7051856.1 hypothetical protein REJC140_01784 [Pseudorhizobium endolithicum]